MFATEDDEKESPRIVAITNQDVENHSILNIDCSVGMFVCSSLQYTAPVLVYVQ